MTTELPDGAGPGRHLSGVFAPTTDEVDVDHLPVDGHLPDELCGAYLRNGPNPRFAPIGCYSYPADGDAMIHRVRIDRGRACYTNRFVRTPALVAEEAAGEALWPGVSALGATPGARLVGPALAHTRRDRPNVGLVHHGDRLLATADSGLPFRLDEELRTVGPEDFGGTLPLGVAAHPRIDPRTGELVLFRAALRPPYLSWSVVGADGLTTRAATPVEGVLRPSLVHDMALTRTFVVVVLGPWFLDLDAALRTGSPLSWEPDEGTRIALVPRDGGPVRWLVTEAFWSWHLVNAFDLTAGPDGEASGVVCDYVHREAPGRGAGLLSRLVVDLRRGHVERTTLDERSAEFATIDPRLTSRPHRTIAVTLRTGPQALPAGDADTLGWYDTQTGQLGTWREPGLSVGEQTWAPRPGDADPANGWWLSLATHRDTATSELLVFPAAIPGRGPQARVRLPHRVPAGLHGTWLPGRE